MAQGDGTRGSVLLLHGFTGAVQDIQSVTEGLTQAGFFCSTPRLPGHETNAADLNSTPMQAWLDAARRAFLQLPGEGARFVVGLSMGGLLAIHLAAELPADVKAVVLLSPALKLRPRAWFGVILARLGLYHFLSAKQKAKGRDIASEQGRSLQSLAYKSLPLKALVEFDKVRRLALRELPRVECPVYAAFGLLDGTVNPRGSAACLEGQLHTSRPEMHFFERSSHILPLDFDQEKLVHQVVAFVEAHV